MHSRRALLYMPGDDWNKINKAITLGVDCICMDMEDGVAITRKLEARAVIAQAMKELDFGKAERCIRIPFFTGIRSTPRARSSRSASRSQGRRPASCGSNVQAKNQTVQLWWNLNGRQCF